MQGRQNAARIRIEEVKHDIGYFILKNSVTILLMRDFEGTNEVVESARKNEGANIVLDALMLEKKLFKQIFSEKAPAFTYNSEVVNRLNILMSEIGIKIAAESIPTITGDGRYFGTVRTRQEMIERFERVLYDTYADELKLHFFRSIILDEIATRIDRDSVNVVIVNVLPNMVRAFSSYTGKTQVMKNEGAAPAATSTATPRTFGLEKSVPEQTTNEKKAYTGAKRGRKTNAERAAMAAQKNQEGTGQPQNEG